jgi:hypothetical protein
MIKVTIMTKNLQHVSAVGIQFSAALSALGQNAAELQHALTHTENTLSQREDLIAGRRSGSVHLTKPCFKQFLQA